MSSITRRVFSHLSRLPEIVRCRQETAAWLPVTLAYLGLKRLQFPHQLKLRTGENMVLREHTDLIIFWLVFARCHYPVQSSDRLIVDVGANVGLFTIYAAREAPNCRIFAVEPFPDTCHRLRDHIKQNRLEDRVTVLNFAVEQERGLGNMDLADGIPSQYRRIHSVATAPLNKNHRGASALPASGVQIEKRTLSDIIEMIGDDIDLLKMNIHGSEYAVLMSTPAQALRKVGRIVVQYHELPASAKMGKAQLFSHLKERGFQLVQDKDTGRGAGLAVLIALPAETEISLPAAG